MRERGGERRGIRRGRWAEELELQCLRDIVSYSFLTGSGM